MKLKRKDYVLLILICIVIVAIGLPMLVKWKSKSNLIQTEGFDNIRGINLVGVDKNSFLQSKIYDSASDEKGKCYNFKLRKMDGVDTIFYMKTDTTDKLFYENLDKTGGMKWFFMNGKKELSEKTETATPPTGTATPPTTPPTITKIHDYEYIDFGSLKGKIILNMDDTSIMGNKGLYLYKIESDNLVKDKTFISVHSGYFEHISFVKGDIKEYALYFSTNFSIKTLNRTYKIEIDNNNLNKEPNAIDSNDFRQATRIEKPVILTPVRIDGTMKNMVIDNKGDDMSISISKSLIVNQFKRTKDYNTLDTMMKDSTIIGATSYNNSIYIVGFFTGKYSEIDTTGDKEDVMEMIKLKVIGNEVIIESIVSFPNDFLKNDTPFDTDDIMSNLLVLNNQIMMHYKGMLYTIWDGSKDPSYITRPRRAKASLSGKYLITDEAKLDPNPLPSISTGSSKSGLISMEFVLKEEDVKGKERIVPMGLVLKHNSTTQDTLKYSYVKRFKFDPSTLIDNGSSFGFYDSGESSDVSEIKKDTEYYFLFQQPKPLDIESPTTPTPATTGATQKSVKLKMILTDIGTNDLVTKFKEGKAEAELKVNISVKLLYYIFEEGVSDALENDKCKKLDNYIASMGASDFKLDETNLQKYNKFCEDEYNDVMNDVMNNYDLNNLSDGQLKILNGKLQSVYKICTKISETIKGKNIFKKDKKYVQGKIDAEVEKLEQINIKTKETLDKIKNNKLEPQFVKGFSDSYTYFINLIKKNIWKQKVNEDNRISVKNNELKEKMDKYIVKKIKLDKQLCPQSEYNYNINSMLDNMNMYKAYNKSIYDKYDNKDDEDDKESET